MRQQRWEKRSEQLSGALWVLPLLFVVGALVLGSALSQITIEPGSRLDPLLFRGDVDEARRVLFGVATTVVGVLALVIGLTVLALQVAPNRYSPRSVCRGRPSTTCGTRRHPGGADRGVAAGPHAAHRPRQHGSSDLLPARELRG